MRAKETLINSRLSGAWMCRDFRRLQGVENESMRNRFSNAVLMMARMAIDQRLPGRE